MAFTQVNASIKDQIAVTKVEQEFYNPNPRQLEGTFLFPVPKGAQINKFTMEINGKQVEAELLAADKARGIYEDIVRKLRDPALLEYAGRVADYLELGELVALDALERRGVAALHPTKDEIRRARVNRQPRQRLQAVEQRAALPTDGLRLLLGIIDLAARELPHLQAEADILADRHVRERDLEGCTAPDVDADLGVLQRVALTWLHPDVVASRATTRSGRIRHRTGTSVPAKCAGIASPMPRISGKFHGTTWPTTPTG